MDVARSLRRGVQALVIGALLLSGPALGTSSARAPAGHRSIASPSSVATLQIGPIRAAGGFSLYLIIQGCGGPDPALGFAYVKGTSTAALSHTYTGASASCSIRRASAGAPVQAAQVQAVLPGLADVGVQIAVTPQAQAPSPQPALSGQALSGQALSGLPVGCSGTPEPEVAATATGHIDVSIHPAGLGQISVPSAGADIFSGTPPACPARQSTAGQLFSATVGSYTLNAIHPTHGAAQLEIVGPNNDSPGLDLQGTLAVQLTGRAALGVNLADASTRVGASTRVTSGSLSFTALAECPGYVAQNGNLSGILTIQDPLFGPLRINGADATAAFSGPGTAPAGSCDGPGSQPVAPDLVSSCNQDDSGCSVSAQSSVATFYDETSPGTQAIVAETVDFGDGSAPAAIGNYGALQHSYAAPGTYTATLSVTDAAGAVSTATTSVVIDP
jgi:hypothetical protein